MRIAVPTFLAVVLSLATLAMPQANVSGVVSVIDGDTIEIHGERVRLNCQIRLRQPRRNRAAEPAG